MLTHRQVVLQVLLMHPAKGSQEVTRRRPQPLDGIGVHLAHSVPVIVPRPLALTVADGAACPLDPVVTAPFIRVTSGPRQRVRMHVLPQSHPIRMLANSQAALPAPSPNSANHRWPVVVVGAVAAPLVGTPPRW